MSHRNGFFDSDVAPGFYSTAEPIKEMVFDDDEIKAAESQIVDQSGKRNRLDTPENTQMDENINV